jgi:hypothetical protein
LADLFFERHEAQYGINFITYIAIITLWLLTTSQ